MNNDVRTKGSGPDGAGNTVPTLNKSNLNQRSPMSAATVDRSPSEGNSNIGQSSVTASEEPWAPCTPCRFTERNFPLVCNDAVETADLWENDRYYGTLRRAKSGFFVGNSPWALIGITALDESARHDWRDFQQIKNELVGREWEAVELYPAESRLVDPSNRFYLWCAPKGCFQFGFEHRRVYTSPMDGVPQRPYAIQQPTA